MKLIFSTLKKVLFWSYERGSWQYDVMCVVILAFIIFAPNRVFEQHDVTAPIILRSEEIGSIDPANLEQMESKLQQITGNRVAISRIEKARDTLGEVYLIYQK
ncbi:MAG TPA: hypothetical protein VLM38_19340 [Blastocatellia bacterium]|nr:hypothetical protein [Blastocatellia bacterium]